MDNQSKYYYCTDEKNPSDYIELSDTTKYFNANCTGYAVSRAFGKKWFSYNIQRDEENGLIRLDTIGVVDIYHAGTLDITDYYIPREYFEDISDNDLTTTLQMAKPGYIIGVEGSSNHVVFIESVDTDGTSIEATDIHIAEKAYRNSKTERRKTLNVVLADYGWTRPHLWRLINEGKLLKVEFKSNLDYDANKTFNRGYFFVNSKKKGFPYTLADQSWGNVFSYEEAIDGQTHLGYKQAFDEWSKTDKNNLYVDFESADKMGHLTILSGKDNPLQLKAIYKKIYKITIENSFVSLSNQGIVKVNNQVLSIGNTPLIKEVKQNNQLRLEAIDQTINGIKYKFSKWSTVETTRTFNYIANDGNITIKAIFIGKPLAVTNFRNAILYNQNIKLTWDANPNPNCQYKIFRYVKDSQADPIPESEYPCAILDHNITTWTDPLYKLTRGYTDCLLYFDIQVHYSVERTFTPLDNLFAVFGTNGGPFAFSKDSIRSENTLNELPDAQEKDDIVIYPNPFNPATTIQIRVEKATDLKIIIYDMNGRIVKNLFSGFVAMGVQTYVWHGTDDALRKVSSGVYILNMLKGTKSAVRKLVLMK